MSPGFSVLLSLSKECRWREMEEHRQAERLQRQLQQEQAYLLSLQHDPRRAHPQPPQPSQPPQERSKASFHAPEPKPHYEPVDRAREVPRSLFPSPRRTSVKSSKGTYNLSLCKITGDNPLPPQQWWWGWAGVEMAGLETQRLTQGPEMLRVQMNEASFFFHRGPGILVKVLGNILEHSLVQR